MPTTRLYDARRDSDDAAPDITEVQELSSSRAHPRIAERGFTIVEIFAALLVMAVGIIGIAALYSDQVQTDADTQLHRQAAALADEIAARIRATKEGHAGFATTIGVLCDSPPKRPQPQDTAAHEAACWEDEVERRLPSGLGSITRDVLTTPQTYVIAVSWSAPDAGTASYVIRVAPDTEPPRP
jgi:type IV pilus modification protein PilV